MVQPSTKVMATPTSPMETEMRSPYIIREKKSRPRRSLPKSNSTPSSDTPNRWRSDSNRPHSLYGSVRAKSCSG